MADRTVAICSNSLLLSVIADHLRNMAGICVSHFSPYAADAVDLVLAGQPDMVLVECNTYTSNPKLDRFILELLQAAPGLPVVGLSATHSAVLVLSSQRIEAGQFADLLHLMNGLCANDSRIPLDAQSYSQPARSVTLDPLLS